PGSAGTVTVHLEPGRYAMFCYVPAPDGVSHAQHGMVKLFDVVDRGNTAPAPRPVATAVLENFDFNLPRPFPAHGDLKVVNRGTQAHERAMYKLAPGKTLDALKNYTLDALPGGAPTPAGPPPYADAAGVVGLSPGNVDYMPLDLSPGTYAFLCYFPDK